MRIAYLHGFAGSPAAWDDVATQVPGKALALPGHGGGPVLDSWDANLGAVAEQLGDADLVVGYSLGARVALGLVASDRAARAILISVNPGVDADARDARRVFDASWAAMLRERGLATFLDAWEAQPLFATQAQVPEDRRAARRARRLELDPEQLARSLETMGLAEMPDYHADIPRLAGRLFAIAGADDPKYAAIASSLGVPFAIIDGAGHDPLLEQPAALAAALVSFRDRR
ncbi:MAG: alpha/beta fold hydrolase [Deltaproteobacteria bacterium]|nr:alpha/beta fold hydrolase [Deltaproteobacteria bacterium]